MLADGINTVNSSLQRRSFPPLLFFILCGVLCDAGLAGAELALHAVLRDIREEVYVVDGKDDGKSPLSA